MDKKTVNDMARQLLAGGIPRSQVRRYLQEVRDHFSDLVLEGQRRGLDRADSERQARLAIGGHQKLVDAMLEKQELYSLGKRFPLLLLLGPLFGFMLVFVALGLLAIGVATSFDEAGLPQDSWVPAFMHALRLFAMHLLSPLLAAAMLCYAIRNRLSLCLAGTGAILVCLLGCMIHIRLGFPDPVAGTRGQIGVSIAFRLWPQLSPGNNTVRFALTMLTLGLPLWLYYRHCEREFA